MKTEELIIKWATSWGNEIERVECTKETDKCIWRIKWNGKPSRCDKDSRCEKYHDSWESAHRFLISRTSSNIESARKALEKQNSILVDLFGMKNPESGL